MTRRTIPKLKTRIVCEPDDDLGAIGRLVRDGSRVVGIAFDGALVTSRDAGATFHRTPVHHGAARTRLRGLFAEGARLVVFGEAGLLALSIDHGLTWTRVPLASSGRWSGASRAPDGTVGRAPDGALWICGDDGALIRSLDGLHWEPVASGATEQLFGVYHVGGDQLLVDGGGHLLRRTATSTETLLEAGAALSNLVVTARGTWLVFGDDGHAHRSTDAGRSFTRIGLPTGENLEDSIASPLGVIAVGAEGTVLFSDDDGRSFVELPTELEVDLWTIAAIDGGFLIGGNDGLVARLDAIPGATTKVTVGDIVPHETTEAPDDAPDEEASPTSPLSLDEASARWITEGRTFLTELNAYVRRCYTVGPNRAGDEPAETRQDLADYVRAQLVRLNAAGTPAEARRLFPPAYEPFDYDGLGRSVDAALFLDATRRLVCSGAQTYLLERGRITPVDDVIFVGRSPDRRWLARCLADRIDIHDGWDGPVRTSLAYPRGYPGHPFDFEPASIVALHVTPEGDAAVLASSAGIFWVHAAGSRVLLPEPDALVRRLADSDDEAAALDLSYPHAAMSPNGRFLAIGTQDTAHLVLDRKTNRLHGFDPVSSYPHAAVFHHDRPEVILSSCHALYGSGSLVVDLDRLATGAPSPARVLDRRSWVYVGGSTATEYLLGDRSGYIWAKRSSDLEQAYYIFIGSSLTALDLDPTHTRILVGSHSGYVVELDLTAPDPDPALLTDANVREVARWVFWNGHPPLCW